MESQWENLWKYVIETWNAESYVSGELNNLQEGEYLWPLSGQNTIILQGYVFHDRSIGWAGPS